MFEHILKIWLDGKSTTIEDNDGRRIQIIVGFKSLLLIWDLIAEERHWYIGHVDSSATSKVVSNLRI